jgi:hypothetical protein
MKSIDLKLILTQSAEISRTICVFDLDSTLFNVSSRTQKILHEFADEHKPELKNVEVLHTDWGLKESLYRAGYKSDAHPELHKSLRDYWVERFFTNEYLHYDIPYTGAVAFVQRLAQTNCEIHYLTGRDIKRMGQGTLEVLLKWGFPVSENQLHLKPDRAMNDHQFKVDFMIQKFPVHTFSKLYFFENEPVNINALGKVRPDFNIVYLDTTHSRQQQVEVEAYCIENFVMSEI